MRRLWWVAVGSLGCVSCSVFGAVPPQLGEKKAERAAHCNFWYPVADTVSVLAAATWVAKANQLEDDSKSRSYTLPDGSQGVEMIGRGTDYSALRDAGYGAIIAFGASALWGYYVQLRCARPPHAPDGAELGSVPKPKRARAGFPNGISGYLFGTRPAEAQRICESKGQTFSSQGSTAECSSAATAPGAFNVRLQFSVATLSEITAFYGATPADAKPFYDKLYASYVAQYGEPDSAAPPLSASCGTSLAACLEAGEQLEPATWRWASGSLQLARVWHADHVEVDIHFVKYDAE